MHKFKIGDKVKVVDEKAMADHSVDQDAIREGTVKAVDEDGCVKLQEDHTGWWYPENCLDFVPWPNPQLSAPVAGSEPTQKTYTVREVLEAYHEYNGYSATLSDMTLGGVQKLLDRRDDPDYHLYLELKKRFETDN